MMPRFSVIVPIYNVECFLEKCINSLIEQKYGAVEIILVDDGSSDRCPQICDRYLEIDNRIKVIHKKNGGLVSARQAGCKAASGEYILNVDGDDWVTPEYFQKLDHIVEKYHPDCICFGVRHIHGNNKEERPIAFKPGLYNKRDMELKIFPILIEDEKGRYFSPSIWSKAIKRDIYSKCQMALDDRIKIGEDHACTKPAIYRSKTLYILEESLYCYRLNALSMTKERKAFSWEGPELIGRHFEKEIPMKDGYNFEEQVYRNIVHNLFNVAVSQFYRKESFNAVSKNISQNIKQPYYKQAIMNCKYKNVKGVLAHFTLKYHLYCILYLWAKINKYR